MARSPVTPPRFYAPALADEPVVTLPREEGRHLTRVLRLRRGDVVTVFDGRGRECTGRVEQVSRDMVQVRILEPCEPAPEAAVHLTLAQAVLKGDSMDAIVRDATMLGVAAIQPVVATRSQIALAALQRGAARDRWRRVAIASAKQCRRAVLPEIRPPLGFHAFCEADPAVLRIMLVEPGAAGVPAGPPELLQGTAPASATVAIGPEGGWTPGEVELASACGFVPLTLGRLTLRAEAAPLAALAILRFLWGDL